MFDLDGTLIDSTEVYYQIVEVALQRLGMPAVPRRAILDAAQDGDFDWSRILPPDRADCHDDLIRKAWKVVQEIYPGMFQNGVGLVPGAADAVSAIAAAGMRLGIVTSTPRTNMPGKIRLLEKAGIFDLIGSVITSDDAPRKKPAPDPLIACGKRLGVAPGRNVYVGDTRMDILAGRAAGMKTVGVLTGFDRHADLESASPDLILPSVADLSRLL